MSDLWDPATTPNFSAEEMACKCGQCSGPHGGEMRMTQSFMEKLQAIRTELGRGMKITSGYRCSKHPDEVRKEVPGSHSQGRAADIAVVGGAERFRLIELGLKHGMVGLGVANSFIHLDDGHGNPRVGRPSAWKY